MKGTLYFVNNAWIVKYYNADVKGGTTSQAIGIIPLHMDSVKDTIFYEYYFNTVHATGHAEIEFRIMNESEPRAVIIEHETWKDIRNLIAREIDADADSCEKLTDIFSRLETEYEQPFQKTDK